MPTRLIVAEPATSYAKRAYRVVDSSVLGAWLFGEPRCAEAEALMHGWQLAAPQLIDYEIANIGMNKLRGKVLESAAIEAILEQYARTPVERFEPDTGAIFELAAKYNLSCYDAAYLLLADQLGAPLATFDGELGRVALAHFAQGTS
jgi:predicted nucleic acid-binding protein